MWVFTPLGFFSAVSHRDRPGYLLVRSRAKADLENLAKRLGKSKKLVAWTPRADYPYRIAVTKKAFVRYLTGFVLEGLTYPNFKAEVPERMHVYHQVWDVLHGLEDGHPRRAMEPRGSIAGPVDSPRFRY